VKHPVVHLVGSVPLPDNEAVFRSLARALGHCLKRMPDGETGIRQSWIRFLQDALAEHPAIEVATDLAPFRFEQWDGKLVREIRRLRVIPDADLDPNEFNSGYAEMALDSWHVFEKMQSAGTIPDGVKFQICMPTPVAPTYNNMVPSDRPKVLAALTRHFIGEVERIAAQLPNDKIAVQWDVCQEVLAWEGYYEPGPVGFEQETLSVLAEIGNAVPAAVELGFHLCYGSPLDAHIVQPRDTGIMVEIINALSARVDRSIQYFHLPVPQNRSDDAYFSPLTRLEIDDETELYFGLIHHDDDPGNVARLAVARKYARVDGVATECGMGRGDSDRLSALLATHAELAQC